MAQPTPDDLPQSFLSPQQYLTEHGGDVVVLFTTYLPLTIALLFLTATITWVAAMFFYKKRIDDLKERIQLKDDRIAGLAREQKELTKQLQSTTTNLNEYDREFAHGFHPTMDQVADGLIALSYMGRKVPVKIVATPEAHSFAKQLASALTSMNYKVLPHGEQIHGIVPARSPHNKIIVRYEEKADNFRHSCTCSEMAAALNHFVACEVNLFPPNSNKDYFQIELLGGL